MCVCVCVCVYMCVHVHACMCVCELVDNNRCKGHSPNNIKYNYHSYNDIIFSYTIISKELHQKIADQSMDASVFPCSFELHNHKR